MELIQPAPRSFMIPNDFIGDNWDEAGVYFDLSEVASGVGAFIAWATANVRAAGASTAVLEARALFTPTGIVIHEDGDAYGNDINCQLREDSYAIVRTLARNVVHPYSVRRIYTVNTNARRIEILGISGSMIGATIA